MNSMIFKELGETKVGADGTILFVSYEPRSTRVAQDLAERGYLGEVVVLYSDDLLTKATARNLKTTQRLFGKKAIPFGVSVKDPSKTIGMFRKLGLPRSLLVDISCFNRENLFSFLWSARLGIDCFPDITFAYTAAQEYGKWLSRGYGPAHNLVGFGGGLRSYRRKVLICMVGYESLRALAVIKAAEPSEVILAVGAVPKRGDFLRRNSNAVREVLGPQEYEIKEIDVLDPTRCLRDLEQLIEPLTSNAAIHIAPFNTKLSCLCVYSLWLKNRNIRLWNVVPETYNVVGYSRGAKKPRYFKADWEP